ncbi:hypothetical protein C3Z13_00505 [Avibacterium endocarditidis]|uniref:Uncharacterized protein n=1 Tax=Avibacterium endocarditidis TaxID=380674 RepID=A0ABX4ZUI6_9PAST|nr:hypothetical protein C3Z13_00505 [Avibacterium endocarditidis]
MNIVIDVIKTRIQLYLYTWKSEPCRCTFGAVMSLLNLVAKIVVLTLAFAFILLDAQFVEIL